MTGTGSLAHNRRDFVAENVDPNRVYLNICYRDENLKDVYKELFDESVERYNVGKRNDRKITNYYDKIQQGSSQGKQRTGGKRIQAYGEATESVAVNH